DFVYDEMMLTGPGDAGQQAAEYVAKTPMIGTPDDPKPGEGPTKEELDEAKSYLTGSYALRFDTSSKVAGQLLQIQIDDLGIDYIDKRNALVEAVTLEDLKRVAARLEDAKKALVVVVGRPAGLPGG
ncbi:MAG: hypothetical protein B7Z15_17015, partial [Rhizobiales bacterium 32-66-8]